MNYAHNLILISALEDALRLRRNKLYVLNGEEVHLNFSQNIIYHSFPSVLDFYT